MLDCEEDRDVAMKLLMMNQGDVEKCAADSRHCFQEFIVLCEDYWSEAYATSYAILKVEATRPADYISPDSLREKGYYLTLRVHRELRCDSEPFDDGFWSDCEAWDCPTDCCEEFAYLTDVRDGRDIPLAELEPLGELPCFVLEPDQDALPAPAGEGTPAPN